MDTTTLPVLVPVQPKVINNQLDFVWNNEEVKNYLISVTERYKNLVVTDENEQDMNKVLTEIKHLRTSISKFRTNVNRKLKEPITIFDKQIAELLGVVANVENPLVDQLDVYEQKRITKLKLNIITEIENKAHVAGLKGEIFKQFVHDNKWLNKTAKWSETTISIDKEINRLVCIQKEDEERKKLIAERYEMAKEYVTMANEKYHLQTPMQLNILQQEFAELTVTQIKERIYAKAESLHNIEQQAIERSEQKRKQQEERLLAETQQQVELQERQQSSNPVEPIIDKTAGPNFKDVVVTFHDVNMANGDYETLIDSLDKIMKWKFETELK